MHWGKVTCIPIYVEMTVCWFLSILLLLFFFLHETAEKDHDNHRLECSLAKPHYWKRDEMATLSQTFPCPWGRKQWFKKRKRSWEHEKVEDNKINGWDFGDTAPGDEREEGGKCQIPEWFGLEGALQSQSPAKDKDTFHQNSKDKIKRLLHSLSTENLLWVNTPHFFSKTLCFWTSLCPFSTLPGQIPSWDVVCLGEINPNQTKQLFG